MDCALFDVMRRVSHWMWCCGVLTGGLTTKSNPGPKLILEVYDRNDASRIISDILANTKLMDFTSIKEWENMSQGGPVRVMGIDFEIRCIRILDKGPHYG